MKLMGRHSGFIACYAALAKNDADYVLIPEVPFALDGEDGFLAHLRRTVQGRGHAVIVVAEGAGQEHLAAQPTAADASGNVRLGDIHACCSSASATTSPRTASSSTSSCWIPAT